jgi:hypothetical protein
MAESAKFAATSFDAPRTKDRMGSKQMLTSHAMLKKPNRDHALEPILKPPDLYSLSHKPSNY